MKLHVLYSEDAHDMVSHLLSSTQCWASLVFSLSLGIQEIDDFCVPGWHGCFFSLKLMPRPQFAANRFALIADINIEMKKLPFFFKNLIKKKVFFPKCDFVIFWPNLNISSDLWLFNVCFVATSVEQAVMVSSYVTRLVTFCWIPIGQPGTGKWGSQL